MTPRRSRFGYLTTSKHVPLTREDSLKGVLARSRRKSKKPISLASVGEKEHGRPVKTTRDK
jgi:hypothetical protein